ncbi:hypothetical protein C1646_775134 [Rhizophagus diaphanus]|nr:hypothetical protein C1646_775134 [Rhizophagus diaphanus] [Rhizophagus sp. MUCL 43196]
MPLESHNFHPYFTFVKNTINKGNAFAVCNSCINNCDGETFSEEEVKKILKLPVPEDKVNDIIEVDNDDESIQNLAKRRRLSTSTVSSFNSIGSQQKLLTLYYHRQMSTNDVLRFEQLFIRMTVSNGFSFFFVENEETKALFEFIAPDLVLPNCKAISGRILKDVAESLQHNIVKITANDKNGITAAFDGWTNVKMKQLWGVVFIISKEQPLVWGAHKINAERSCTTDVI